MSKYSYRVWNDGTNCPTHCYMSIHEGDRVITEDEFIQPSLFDVLSSSNNKLIEKMLKKGRKLARERISILEKGEIK